MYKLPQIKTKRLKKAILAYYNFKSHLKHSTGSVGIPVNQKEKFDNICSEVLSAFSAEGKSGVICAGTIVMVEKIGLNRKRSCFINTKSNYEDASFKMTDE